MLVTMCYHFQTMKQKSAFITVAWDKEQNKKEKNQQLHIKTFCESLFDH